MFIETIRIGPKVAAHQPPVLLALVSSLPPAKGLGSRYSARAGTPHSPPLSPDAYKSRGEIFPDDVWFTCCHVSGVASYSWFPTHVRNGTLDAHGVICSPHSSHTLPYPVA